MCNTTGETYVYDEVGDESQEDDHEGEDRIQNRIRDRHIVLHLHFGMSA
jgi:hypothetical protein